MACAKRWGLKQKRREAFFQPEFIEDLRYWVETDRKLALRVFELIDSILRDPFEGIGKPEPLKHALAGYWSRRINDEHRLVYKVEGDSLLIAQCKLHY